MVALMGRRPLKNEFPDKESVTNIPGRDSEGSKGKKTMKRHATTLTVIMGLILAGGTAGWVAEASAAADGEPVVTPSAIRLEILPAQPQPSSDDLSAGFQTPPLLCRPTPFIFVNAPMNAERTAQIMAQAQASGFGGVCPIPGSRPKFLGEDYFTGYGQILKGGREQNLKVIFYDTPGFPSGLGVDFRNKYRAFSQRRLDMTAQDFQGPAQCNLAAGEGVVMAAVAMNTATWERVNLAAFVKDGNVSWAVPPGPWKVMLFACVEQRNEHIASHLPDYLNPAACDKFIEEV